MISLFRPAKQRPRRARTRILRAAYYFFLTVSILALGYTGYVVAEARTYQASEITKFENAGQPAEPRLLEMGGVIGELEVPRLGLKVIVVQGDSAKVLRRAVGHLPETALPGEAGNVVLAGHRDTFFRPLRNIRQGDAILLKTSGGDFQYQVESIEVVSPGAVEVLGATSGRTLTLITCFPFYYVGAAPDRFVVYAREVGKSPQQTRDR
jgi:sortase A